MTKMNVTLIKKITVKTVCGSMKRPGENDPEHKLMMVVGVATGVKSGESNFGPWQALRGQFQATNMETGEIFRSGVCILPNIAQDLLLPQLFGEGVNGVEFGLEIGVRPSSTPIGYEYTCNPVFQADNDPLAHVLAKLPAPDVKSAPEPVQERKHGRK